MFYSYCPGIKAVKKTLDFWNGLIFCSSSMLSWQNGFYLYYSLLIFVNTTFNWAAEPSCVWCCANTSDCPCPEDLYKPEESGRGSEGSRVLEYLAWGGRGTARTWDATQNACVIAWPCFPVMQLPGPYTVCNSYGSNKKQTWYSSGDRDVGKAAIQLAFIEWLGFERSSKLTHPQPPAVGQGCHSPAKAALGSIQTGLECLKGWGILNVLSCFYLFSLLDEVYINLLLGTCIHTRQSPANT